MTEKILTKAAIEAAKDLPTIQVPVAEWGGTVTLRSLNGLERDDFDRAVLNPKTRNVRALLVGLCLVGADGQRLYGDDQIEALGKKSGKVLDLLFDRLQVLNGLTRRDLEELEKN